MTWTSTSASLGGVIGLLKLEGTEVNWRYRGAESKKLSFVAHCEAPGSGMSEK